VFLQGVQGRTALEAGLILLPQGVLIAVFAPVAGRLTASVGARVPIAAGMALSALGFLALVRLEADTSPVVAGLGFGLLGIGTGLALPAMTVTALGAARVGAAGMASAIHQASRQLGQTLGVAVLGTIVFSHGDLVAGLHAALLASAVAVALTGVVVTRMVAGAKT
jgi:predicted MFS family arabinose efflux permease